MSVTQRLFGTRWPRWTSDWLLSRGERGNDAAGVGTWSGGNAVRLIPHGVDYFAALDRELADVGPGDLVLVAGWRFDGAQRLGPESTVASALAGSASRGALVRGLAWRSHPSWIVGSLQENKSLARTVNRAGGRFLLDHRVRPLGSHHQKFVVIRRAADPDRDVAFVGGIDLARSRADSVEHTGDPLPRDFAAVYGPTPAWHDVQLEIRGPAVRDVEEVFRERWSDPAPMTRLPWHRLPDRVAGLPQQAGALPPPRAAPPARGRARVQLLRTYPARRPGYPFAPDGEFSVARGFVKALQRARRLVYLEDQYLWSAGVGTALDAALRANRDLQVVAVCPRYADQEGRLKVDPALLGQGLALRALSRSVRDRVTLLDIENDDGWPIYVHAKISVIDDVWASVGSSNLNRRSWTHDTELTVAVLDDEHIESIEPIEPVDQTEASDSSDPSDAPLLRSRDGARRFARDTRVQLVREHLGRPEGADADLEDPAQAVQALRDSAAALDAWYDGGQVGPRPPGRLRRRVLQTATPWRRALIAPVYNAVFDPDGRTLRQRLRRRH